MSGVETYLRSMIEMRRTMRIPDGWRYCCQEDFVIDNGAPMRWAELPMHLEPGTVKACFRNAFALAEQHRHLTYCEGFAAGIIPTLHAWCVDEAGYVIDPTWCAANGFDNPAEYYGVRFPIRWVLHTIAKSGTYGVIDNWKDGHPLIRVGMPDLARYHLQLEQESA